MGSSRLIRVLMVLAVLSAGPPARKHAHAAGDRPHRHAHTGGVRPHIHGHPAPSRDAARHDAARHDADHEHSLDESCPHLHVSLFGIDLTLPLSDDEEDAPGASLACCAAPPAAEVERPHAASILCLAPCHGWHEAAPAGAPFRSIAAPAAPLSDNARHERSGVQLI
jgi:hypothetical protein